MEKSVDRNEAIVIIGAGPAGLAIAGRLRKLGKDFIIIEKDDVVSSMWHKHYDRLHLHTVKQLSHLPHLPFPDSYPTYVPREQLVAYYADYAKRFDIIPRFNTEVINIHPENNHWLVSLKGGTSLRANQVVIATGANRIPYLPKWEGQDLFSGKVTHSRDYKNSQPFEGKKVLVVGMGNTGAEIALDLAENGVENYLSVRSPINIVPRDVFGKPAQLTAKLLEKLPFNIGKVISKISTRLIIGDLSKYGIEHSKMHPVDQLKQTGQTPVIDLGTVAQIKKGNIKIVADVSHFSRTGVVLRSDERLVIDDVILATGYKTGIESLLENTDGLLDKYGLPKNCIGTGSHRGLYFLGFDNYQLGGLLGTIYQDSEKVANAVVGVTAPS